MHCAKMFEYSHYIYCLQEDSTHFGWFKAIDKLLPAGIGTFWDQKIIQEKATKFTSLHAYFSVPKC